LSLVSISWNHSNGKNQADKQIQIVQWTISSAPSHPILLSTILRILHSTAKALDWQHAHVDKLEKLRDQGKSRTTAYKELEQVNVLDEPAMGGPLGVMDWTGPGLFTDAVLG
jgi:alpha 1,6-mannosyltransferase